MKATSIHKMNDEELVVEVDRLRRHLYDLRCQRVTEQIEDTSQFKKTKKDIARLLTERRARQIRSAKESS
ncbi:MAG TPA: 50S ribosomal protein L29 [Phycisphaeraceae bacterium]|nr:50S ribosomal protein L29 [Phycisphaeraceae bacterium]